MEGKAAIHALPSDDPAAKSVATRSPRARIGMCLPFT